MKICICDDESVVVNQIRELVESATGTDTIATCFSGEELLQSEESYDIIFLDIQMREINGIETARKIRERTEP